LYVKWITGTIPYFQFIQISKLSELAHIYQYPLASEISGDTKPHLKLATSNIDGAAHPHFFEGRLKSPRLSAELLTTLHLIVGARFFTPANSLTRKLALADPVVTSGGGLLRFEGFSSCCSAYLRVDLLPEAYDGDIVGKGTTNVDFNAPMRAALARVRDADGLALSVGLDALSLRSGESEVIERKVQLPLRWLRGMVEVQAYQASMQKKFEVSGIEALRFFRALPKTSTSKTPLWAIGGASGLRLTSQRQDAGVRVTDTTRLRVLESLLPKAKSLAVYADEAHQSSAWVLGFPGARITLVLSAEIWRGFSGEGQALRALIGMNSTEAKSVQSILRANLQWQSILDAPTLSRSLQIDAAGVERGLRVLGASGLVGFDVSQGSYYHRVLPFDLSLVEEMHPRLCDALELLEQNAVTMLGSAPLAATVNSGGVAHHVREIEGLLRCTCPWFAKHQGQRGPCKHVLAVEASRT
jgi:hypothetical protein